MKSLFLLLRPSQWLKNLFVFLPLFFDKQIGNLELLYISIISFISFCLVSSSIYCLNDILDRDSDRMHPVKRHRPIASGRVSKGQGFLLMFVMLFLSLLLLLLVGGERRWMMLSVVGGYYVMNVGYCLWLKRIALVDVFVIATGFVLRMLMGGVSTGIHLSQWIVLMTFLLALFLAFAKRRDDVIMYEKTGTTSRRNIKYYNSDFMNQVLTTLGTVMIVCYIMYTVSPDVTNRFGSQYVYLTSVCVLAGIIRYLQITLVAGRSGSPTGVLMHDRFIQACLLGWVIMFVVIIYL